jgi:hypothetical protein
LQNVFPGDSPGSSGLGLDVLAREKDAGQPVCPNPPPFYKIDGLLPSVESRKQVPSDS